MAGLHADRGDAGGADLAAGVRRNVNAAAVATGTSPSKAATRRSGSMLCRQSSNSASVRPSPNAVTSGSRKARTVSGVAVRMG
jgi:hypothetical protein